MVCVAPVLPQTLLNYLRSHQITNDVTRNDMVGDQQQLSFLGKIHLRTTVLPKLLPVRNSGVVCTGALTPIPV